MFALAIAHHYLGHRLLRAYAYSREGAQFKLKTEECEAREFAASFLRNMAPVARHAVAYGRRPAVIR